MSEKEVIETTVDENTIEETSNVEVNHETKADKDSEKLEHYKRLISEKNSKLAAIEKKNRALQQQLEEKLTAEERIEAERRAREEEIEAELNQLKLEKDISQQAKEYLAIGLDEDLANETAEALINGDLSTVNRNLKKHFEDVKKRAVADAMANTPRPAIGSETTPPATVDSIMAIRDTGERRKAIAQHPELFNLDD